MEEDFGNQPLQRLVVRGKKRARDQDLDLSDFQD